MHSIYCAHLAAGCHRHQYCRGRSARLEICSEGTTGLSSAQVHPIHSLRVRSPACHSAAETVTKIPGAAPQKRPGWAMISTVWQVGALGVASGTTSATRARAVTFRLSLMLTDYIQPKNWSITRLFPAAGATSPATRALPSSPRPFFRCGVASLAGSSLGRSSL